MGAEKVRSRHNFPCSRKCHPNQGNYDEDDDDDDEIDKDDDDDYVLGNIIVIKEMMMT